MMGAETKRGPYKSQPVIYRAHGGIEYAAIITEVRPDGVSLTTLPPGGGSLDLTRIRYVDPWLSVDGDCVCYPGKPDDVLRK